MTAIERCALAKPDFVERLRAYRSFKDADRVTFYGGNTEYPRPDDRLEGWGFRLEQPFIAR